MLADLAILLGTLLLDLALGEPPARLHPVVWMGKTIGWLQRRCPRGEEEGCGYLLALGLPLAALLGGGLLIYLASRVHPIAGVLLSIYLLKSTLAIRSLARAARRVAEPLEGGNLEAARGSLPALVGRDPHGLDPGQCASAAIESVAENYVDTVVSPFLFYLLLLPLGWGVPAALAYKMVNTLDSMVGYPHLPMGRASAHLDEAANYLPARLGALLLLASHPRRAREGWRTMKRDARLPASRNSGWPMAAMAGLLGVSLEKPGHYLLNRGAPAPGPGDIHRALRVYAGATGLLAAAAMPITYLVR
ncbi:MAG: cobalamin biosynthesis protein CobD [Euryarchaeota archaeon]|nr:cobalamin biosynthesis protein CobD [Euryarchaeota archaeon]